VIDGGLITLKYYSVERVAENFVLSTDQLASVNKILQKNYSEARYIRHKLYDKHAHSPSVIFKTASRSYSECFAGSGELAVVNFVLALENIEPYGLLLLDEPETSLHPGAQEKLTEHLLRLVNEKHIQVIISTHSPTFVQLLPTEALVVLDETSTGVAPRPFPTKASAFERLGVVDKEKITILTEDKLLKAVVDRAVSRFPKPLRDKVNVIPAELGVSEMFSNQVRAHIQAGSNVLMVVDGDQADVEKLFDQEPDALSSIQKNEVLEKLKDLKVSVIGSTADLDGWMRWCKSRVVLLDQVCPEQILLELLNSTHPLLSDPNATNAGFKTAAKSAVYASMGEGTADAQYHVLKYKLGDVQAGTALDTSMQALSDKLKAKLAQFDQT
jgi:energy-coupling factor transporter ATP-binding protein EcfA2